MIDEAKELIDTIPFDEFCNKVNKSFDSINALMQLIKSGNDDIIKVIEDGRK
jgi:hypothetical protein